RRRHTRSTRDWSSDVCSSDLTGNGFAKAESDVGSGSFGLTLTVALPTASISGSTRAQMNHDVASGASLTVEASAPYVALALSRPISIGLVSGSAVASVPEVHGVVVAAIGER